MFALGGIVLAGLAFFAMVFAFVGFVVKAVLTLVFLPFRLLGWAVGAVIACIATLIAIAVGLVVVLAPLIPIAIVGALAYGVYRAFRRPVTA